MQANGFVILELYMAIHKYVWNTYTDFKINDFIKLNSDLMVKTTV